MGYDNCMAKKLEKLFTIFFLEDSDDDVHVPERSIDGPPENQSEIEQRDLSVVNRDEEGCANEIPVHQNGSETITEADLSPQVLLNRSVGMGRVFFAFFRFTDVIIKSCN